MRFSNKAVATEMLKKLGSLSYLAFQNYCREILSEVMPYMAASKEMRRLDSAGVDLFLLTDERNEIEFAFQCKGLEVSHTKNEQTQMCLTSISSLKKLDVKVKYFYFIINRDVYKEERESLESALAEVKKNGMIGNYELLDVRGFINFLSIQITEKFKVAIRESNNKLYDQYRKSLDQRFYYANVPFQLNEKQNLQNPSAFLENNLALKWKGEKRWTTDYEPSMYFFVIGDFGFGKTSLMFESVQRLSEYNAIYIPLSYFKKRDFQNQLEFVMVINKLVTGEENDIKNLFVKFKSRVLAHLLANDPRLVLLFDGMDENMYLGTLEGLKIFFSLLTPVKCKCIFSMRKTFWEERSGNFTVAIPKHRQYKDRISLAEWSNQNILGYIEEYKENFYLSTEAKKHLDEFANIVSEDRYQQYD